MERPRRIIIHGNPGSEDRRLREDFLQGPAPRTEGGKIPVEQLLNEGWEMDPKLNRTIVATDRDGQEREWKSLGGPVVFSPCPSAVACLARLAPVDRGPQVILYIRGDERMVLSLEEWQAARLVFLQAIAAEMAQEAAMREAFSPKVETTQGEG